MTKPDKIIVQNKPENTLKVRTEMYPNLQSRH